MTEEMPCSSRYVDRLTALWALNEAGLGGILNILKTPFSGLIVGGFAIMLIAMIAFFAEKKWLAIGKALILVLIIKAAVSPFSPLASYFAVAFQALAGAIFFSIIQNFRLSAFLFGITALLQTSCQKILVLTILYGKSLWESIDLFFIHILQWFGITSFNSNFSASCWLIITYIFIHAISGAAFGWLAGKLPQSVLEMIQKPVAECKKDFHKIWLSGESQDPKRPLRKRRLPRFLLTLAIISTILAFLAPAVYNQNTVWYIILRIVCVFLLWYCVLSPFLMKKLQHYLKNQRGCYAKEVDSMLYLLPDLKRYAKVLWQKTSEQKAWLRFWQFLVFMVVFALTFEQEEKKL